VAAVRVAILWRRFEVAKLEPEKSVIAWADSASEKRL
jgi:hypothetical protein